jgi:DNA-binding NtrC family response regulator
MQTSAKIEGGLAVPAKSDRPRVLAADDQQHVLEAIELLLRPQGYEVETVRSPALVREALATESYDAVLIDFWSGGSRPAF